MASIRGMSRAARSATPDAARGRATRASTAAPRDAPRCRRGRSAHPRDRAARARRSTRRRARRRATNFGSTVFSVPFASSTWRPIPLRLPIERSPSSLASGRATRATRSRSSWVSPSTSSSDGHVGEPPHRIPQHEQRDRKSLRASNSRAAAWHVGGMPRSCSAASNASRRRFAVLRLGMRALGEDQNVVCVALFPHT